MRGMRARRTTGVGTRGGGRGTREEGGTAASRARGCPATTTRAISEDAAFGAKEASNASGKIAKGYGRWSTMTLGELIDRAGELEAKVDGTRANESEYFYIFRELVRCKRLHDSVDLLKHMKERGVKEIGRRVSHRDFFSACRSLRVVSVGFEFVDVIESGDIRPYNMLVHACATAGDLQAATLAIEKMKNAGFEPDLQAYTTLLGACSKCGDVERAFEVYAELKRAGFEPNEKTYGSMIDAISRDLATSLKGSRKRRVDSEHVRSTLQSCFMIFEEIKTTNMKLDKIVMNSLLTVCARAAVVPSVRKEACEKVAMVHDEMIERGFELDSYAYQALICCALAEKNYTRAFEYFDEMHDAGINGTTEVYTVMIRAYGKLGKADKAKLIWYAMLEDNIIPDQMSYATMMRLALLDEDDDFCDELMTSMRRNRVRPGPELYSTLTGVAARQGDASQVEEIMQNAKKRGVVAPIECYNSLIAAHARADRPDLAVEAAGKLEAAGYELDAISYEGLIFAYAFARDVEEASNMFERLLESGIRPTFPTFNCLVAAHARSGDMDEACRLVSVMKQHGYVEDSITWRELLLGSVQSGDIEAAWKMYKESRASGNADSERALNTILGQTLVHIRSLTDMKNRSNGKPNEFGSFDDEGDYIAQEWTERAVAAFHEATLAGIKPRVETLSTMLACLRPPSTDEQNAAEYSEVARAVSHETSSHEDAARYYPSQALIMYEEAQGLGIVPKFSRDDEDFVYDIREFPPAAAEVMLLTWLRVVRRRTDAHGLDATIPTMTIRVRADEEVVRMIKEQHMDRIDHSLGRLCKTGERLLTLLRRLRINYGGGLQEGTIELSGHALGRWLQGFVPGDFGNHTGSVFSEHSLSGGVRDQAMRIRANSFGSKDDDVWTPSKMRQAAFNIHDYYGNNDDDPSDFGARPFYPKNWVSQSYVSSYDEDDDDATDLERILGSRK